MPTQQETSRATDADYGWFVAIVVVLALFAIGYLVFSANTYAAAPSAHVQVDMPDGGHGSATHIGNGYFLTAAHVAPTGLDVTINGYDTEILWSNPTYDIALLRVPDAEHYAAIPLSCSPLQVGQTGTAYGNPLMLQDIQTTLTVAGPVFSTPQWKVAVPVDGSIGPGMSGGAFVVDGHVAGVNVGVPMFPVGMGATTVGLGVVVPSTVVCELLAR